MRTPSSEGCEIGSDKNGSINNMDYGQQEDLGSSFTWAHIYRLEISIIICGGQQVAPPKV